MEVWPCSSIMFILVYVEKMKQKVFNGIDWLELQVKNVCMDSLVEWTGRSLGDERLPFIDFIDVLGSKGVNDIFHSVFICLLGLCI